MRGRLRSGLRLLLLGTVLPLSAPPQEAALANASKAALPGENLEYAVEWRLVSAGRARLSLTSPVGGNPELESKLHLESTGLVSRLFRVSDDYTVQMTRGFCAQSTFMTAREAGRNRETKVVYDESARKATYREKDLTKNSVLNAETDIPPCVSDVIGGLYKLRGMTLEPGKSIAIPVSNGKKSVMLKVESQRREEIRTPLGPRKTIAYEIYAFNDVLYKRPGHLHVWLTDDSRRTPVQIQIRLQFTIGTITLRLDKDEKT